MIYEIWEDPKNKPIKIATNEIKHLFKGDTIVINGEMYVVDNKRLNVDTETLIVWVEIC